MTVRYKLLCQIAAETGYTEKALRRKIERGEWLEGRHWRRAPDGRIQISVEAYNEWVEGLDGIPVSRHAKTQSA